MKYFKIALAAIAMIISNEIFSLLVILFLMIDGGIRVGLKALDEYERRYK